MELNNSTLHHYILQKIVDTGRSPKICDLSDVFGVEEQGIATALRTLQDYHGAVLHPKSSEVWVMHPFSTAPTNFWIENTEGGWWGNCAWCSLGAAALLDRDLTITTTLGGESKQVVIEIKDGVLMNDDLFIHFPIPMTKAWAVSYTHLTLPTTPYV